MPTLPPEIATTWYTPACWRSRTTSASRLLRSPIRIAVTVAAPVGSVTCWATTARTRARATGRDLLPPGPWRRGDQRRALHRGEQPQPAPRQHAFGIRHAEVAVRQRPAQGPHRRLETASACPGRALCHSGVTCNADAHADAGRAPPTTPPCATDLEVERHATRRRHPGVTAENAVQSHGVASSTGALQGFDVEARRIPGARLGERAEAEAETAGRADRQRASHAAVSSPGEPSGHHQAREGQQHQAGSRLRTDDRAPAGHAACGQRHHAPRERAHAVVTSKPGAGVNASAHPHIFE